MRIAIVTNEIESVGGVQTFTRDVSRILKSRGHNVDVIGEESLSSPVQGDLEEEVGKEFHRRNDEKKYDVVLCNGEFGYAVNHPNAINVFHGNYRGYALSVKGLVDDDLTKKRLEKVGMQKISAREKHIVTVSDYNRIQLEDFGINVDQVIPLSVDTNIFYPDGGKATDTALAVARGMYYEKGFDRLKKLADSGVKMKLFSDVTIDSSSVDNHDFVDIVEMREEYKKASVFLSPTRFEGGGLTALEAMACGCPVLTTPTGYGYDMREVIPDFVVSKPDDIEEWLTKINVLGSNRDKYSKEALEYFQEFHNPEKFKSEWVKLVENL